MNYTCGLIFSQDLERVVLIEKKKPDWQAGLLNGVGGKQEKNERRPRQTMRRECLEECGLDIPETDWTMFAEILAPAVNETRVTFFRVVREDIDGVTTCTNENVAIHRVDDVLRVYPHALIPNLRWLIPLALGWPWTCGPSTTDNVVILEKPIK